MVFYYNTGTHAEPGDDPTGEQDLTSVVCDWFRCFKCLGILL